MSKMKKLASVLLALVMVFAMSATAFAAENYSITINDAADGETYYAYKVFDVTYNEDKTAYSYTIDSSSPFFYYVNISSIFTCTQVGTSSTYVVTLVTITETDSEGNETTRTATAAEILAVLSQATLSTEDADSYAVAADGTATIGLSEAGYYYVTTTLGSVVMLDNADPTAEITDKNGEPTPEKIITDSDASTDGSTSHAAIGDTVSFQVTITDIAGATNLKLIDTLTEGLTLKQDSIEVKLDGSLLTAETDYTVSVSEDGQTLTITFKDDALANATSDSSIVVTYSAEVTGGEEVVLENEVYVTYGNSSTSESSKTETYLGGFKLEKRANSESGDLLPGATFRLYTDETGGTALYFVYDSTTGTYTLADATAADATQDIVVTDGTVYVYGLDSDETYYLEETATPAGYNSLTERQAVTITAGGVTVVEDVESGTSTTTYTDTSVVVNNSGTSLPGTGGIGTTIFYIVGGVMVLGAAVLLITRRRMSTR